MLPPTGEIIRNLRVDHRECLCVGGFDVVQKPASLTDLWPCRFAGTSSGSDVRPHVDTCASQGSAGRKLRPTKRRATAPTSKRKRNKPSFLESTRCLSPPFLEIGIENEGAQIVSVSCLSAKTDS